VRKKEEVKMRERGGKKKEHGAAKEFDSKKSGERGELYEVFEDAEMPRWTASRENQSGQRLKGATASKGKRTKDFRLTSFNLQFSLIRRDGGPRERDVVGGRSFNGRLQITN